MKRALIAVALLLAACSSGDSGGNVGAAIRPSTTAEPTTTTPAPGKPAGQGDYLGSLNVVTFAAEAGEERAVELGLMACDAFDSGVSAAGAIERLQSEPEFLASPGSLAGVVVAAGTWLCPEHSGDLLDG